MSVEWTFADDRLMLNVRTVAGSRAVYCWRWTAKGWRRTGRPGAFARFWRWFNSPMF